MLAVMSVDVCVKVGRRIRALRHEKKMSQEILSALAGLSQANLSILENGKAEPGLRTLLDIAQALNVKLYDLVKGID